MNKEMLMSFKKINILGLNIDAITYSAMIETCDTWLKEKNSKSHHIACVNVNCCVEALLKKELKELFNKADIVGPDGMPFVYLIRHIYKQNCDRMYAPDVLIQFGKIAVQKGYSFYLYGGADGVAKDMKKYLESTFPGINVIGAYTPPFRPLTTQEDFDLCNDINTLKPSFIIVGLGSPKQDIWIQDHLEKIKGSIMIASGATFDFFSGRIKQAPLFIQKSGFEWLYRLFQDPKRLWKRYTYYNVLFIWNYFLQVCKIKTF
jgi:N-acetylglucosaminyldiphosphoundecaprenol N-acetyl-beta-D-mannosaminyltransferase